MSLVKADDACPQVRFGVSIIPTDVRDGSWPCQNALPQRLGMRRGCDASFFFRL